MTEPFAAPDTRQSDQSRRVKVGAIGLAGVVTAIMVAGVLVNRTAEDVMANMTAGGAVPVINEQGETTRNDPLSEIGAAPAAEPVERTQAEEVPGTGATVDPVTGNVSDLPARPRPR